MRKHRVVSSSSDSDTYNVPFMGNDSDESCPVCRILNTSDDDPSAWMSCESCGKWWHVVCAGYGDVELTILKTTLSLFAMCVPNMSVESTICSVNQFEL